MLRSLLIVLLLWYNTIWAQTLIKGTVIDSTTHQPLESVSVGVASNQSILAYTNAGGKFSIQLKPGNETPVLTLSMVGYKTVSIPASNIAPLLIEMQPALLNLKDVVLDGSLQKPAFSTLARVDLALKPVNNTQELLRLVPGLFIAQHAGGGKAEQIFLRGFDCDHGTDISISVDGIPVNMVSHAHGQGYADAHFIIPETISDINYGAGPYYPAQGNFNTAGYVAFNTLPQLAKNRLQVEAGRFATYRGLAMLKLLNNQKNQNAYVAAEANFTNGPTINPQKFTRFNLFGKYILRSNDNSQLTFTASGFKSGWNASGQIPLRAVLSNQLDRFGSIDSTEGGATERYNLNAQSVQTFKNGYRWQNQAYFSRNIFNLYSNFTFFARDTVHGDAINQFEKRNVIGYTTTLSKNIDRNGFSILNSIGAGIRYDGIGPTFLSNVAQHAFLRYVTLGNIKETNAFVYIQKQVRLSKWLINGGIRFDYLNFNYNDQLATLSSRQKGILTQKLSVEYNVNRQLQLFVKAGKGFHSNDTRVVVANNFNTLPAAYGADFGMVMKPFKSLYLQVTAWYLYLQQEFVYVGDEAIAEPSGRTSRMGFEVSGRMQISPSLFASSNVNITRARSIGTPKQESYIPLAPTFTSTGGLYYKKQQGINGGLSYRYISNRAADETNTIVAKGYFIADANVNYSQPGYEVALVAENIFNAKWNEAQFATESRLLHEPVPVSDLNFTPGSPIFFKCKLAVFF